MPTWDAKREKRGRERERTRERKREAEIGGRFHQPIDAKCKIAGAKSGRICFTKKKLCLTLPANTTRSHAQLLHSTFYAVHR